MAGSGLDPADPRGERRVNHLRSCMLASLQCELDAGVDGRVRCLAREEHGLSHWTSQRFPVADLGTYICDNVPVAKVAMSIIAGSARGRHGLCKGGHSPRDG